MNRSQHAGAFVLVEGRHDNLSCKQIVDTSRTKIVVAENKENVCEAIAVLDDDGFTGAVGLVDADFDHLEGIGVSSPNLVLTELHDLECVQLRAAGLAGLLAEFGSSSKLERLGRNVVDVLLLAARPLGC